MAGLRTEFPFVLPKGWQDGGGTLHREGVMRLATARDELDALGGTDIDSPNDPRLTLNVLSRVIVRMGSRDKVTPRDLETFFAADVAHLQDVYSAINYGSQEDIDRLSDPRPLAPLTIAPAPAPAPSPAPLTAVAPPVAKPSRFAPAPVPVPPPAASPVAAEPGLDDPDVDLDEEPMGMKTPMRGRRARIEEVGRVSRPTPGGK